MRKCVIAKLCFSKNDGARNGETHVNYKHCFWEPRDGHLALAGTKPSTDHASQQTLLN